MNEYASRLSFLTQIETMENETLLRLYISSIIGLLVIGFYKLFNPKTPISWFTMNLFYGCFFTFSTCVSARISQTVIETQYFHNWFFMPFTILNCMATLAFSKFANALEITFRADQRVFRKTGFITYCFAPTYFLISSYFKNEIDVIDDLFTIMNIIRMASLLLSIIALINFMTTTYDDSEDERNVEMLVNYAGTTFVENVMEGLFVWFFFKK